MSNLKTKNIIMVGDPSAGLTIDSVKHRMSCIFTTQELVDLFVKVSNKFWYVEDEIYDFEIGTREYDIAKANTDEWKIWYEVLVNQIMRTAEREGLLRKRESNSGYVKQIESFMKKYGYQDGNGWWIKEDEFSGR